jgi:hypothetical protein
MYLECVTVCVNYADFLAITLPRNKGHFDDYVVVTTAEDRETRELCEAQGVRCVLTERLGHNGARFNKGCALNDGFAALARRDWVVILDADIVLPNVAREEIERHATDLRVLFSAKRRIAPTMSLWRRHEAQPDRVPLVETHDDRRGFLQLGPGATGYFVLFHAQSPPISGRWPWCSESFPDASEIDVEFARRWGRYRDWLPFGVVHLGSIRTNWSGRVTPQFA